MPILSMHIDAFPGGRDESRDIEHPMLQEVELAVRQLDGRHRTLVILSADNGTTLGIGGGSDGYVVIVTFSNGDGGNLIAVTPDSKGASLSHIPIVVGAQAVEYSAGEVLTYEQALHAALEFTERDALTCSLKWKPA